MTLLPIADRELRVSARNKATHRLRSLFAVGAVTIGAGLVVLSRTSGGIPGSQLGVILFEALRWIAFVFACAAGIFLTSDCLSEEKREGTLGLLFLTDLRGHDVVLGKLLATSLRTFYGLLAIFPVMALSFIMGGVAADDFQHTLLSLCNTLFFPLALGMAISVVSRDPHKAMSGALGGMVVFLFAIPGMSSPYRGGSTAAWRIGLLSPVFAFTHTSSYDASSYWLSMALVQVAGWTFLAVASWLAPKTWREKGLRSGLETAARFRFFGRADVGWTGPRLRDKNPICWIISRDRWASNLARVAIVLVLGVLALSLASLYHGLRPTTPALPTPRAAMRSTTTTTTNGSTTYTYTVSGSVGVLAGEMGTNNLYRIASWCAGALSRALEFWLAMHVCRFYVDGKRSGFLELLLVTPIRPADVIAGHWLALRRLFLAPVAAQLLLALACGAIQLLATNSAITAAGAGGKALPPTFDRELVIEEVLALGLSVIGWCLGLFAIVWFSIWMSVTTKKINIAVLKTFWYVKILPWFVISFAGIFLAMFVFRIFPGAPSWLWPTIFQLLFIGLNFALIGVARQRAEAAISAWPNLTAA